MPEMAQLVGGSYLIWRGAEATVAVKAALFSRLRLAMDLLKESARKKLSLPSSGGRSRPGEYPHMDTQALRDSLFAAVVVSENEIVGYVASPLKYALYLEYGTSGGQVVRAKAGSVLSWVDPVTGQRRFSKWVRLGAIKPRAFLRQAMSEMRPQIARIMTEEINLGGAVAYG